MKDFIRISLITLLIIFFGQNLKAQKGGFLVEGYVVDTFAAPLMGTTAVILNAKDSVLVSFALSEKTGRFFFKRVAPGDYILQLTFIGYKQINKPVTVNEDNQNLGIYVMEPADLSLGEVTIEGERTPIIIKGDTVEYNADAFKTQANSMVEDLLKKLPGVEVERDGTIKAQGETVQKVLVDGKEFFGDDPKIASQNLPADAVDKVQVFDKKSEIAEFTGIDDGEENKTINLELKEGKKKGVFGTINAGYGPPVPRNDIENRYIGKANVHKFGKKAQVSFLGMMNNTNEQAFSINDYINFMGGFQNLMTSSGGGGGMSLSLNSGQLGMPIGSMIDRGFTDTKAGGLNFNYDIGKKTEIRANYFFNRMNTIIDRTLLRENFLADSEFRSDESSFQDNLSANHRVNLTVRQDIDSFQNIVLKSSFGITDGTVNSNGMSQITNTLGFIENRGTRDNTSDGLNMNLRANLIYKRRFRKKGRSFITDFSLGKQDDERNALIESINAFLPEDPLYAYADSIIQSQAQVNDQLDYKAKATYTEPLGKGKYLSFNVSHQNFSNDLARDVYDLVGLNGSREVFNPLLSDQFQRGYFYNRAGLNFKLNKKKYSLSLGADAQQSTLNGTIQSSGENIKQTFKAILPSLRYNYDFSTSTNISFDYTTNFREPSLEQLQPIVDNSNPLSLYVGNPDLRPEYSHSGNLHFMSYSQFNFTSFFANIRTTYTQNKITNSRFIDSLFRQTTQPINVRQDFTVSSFLSFSAPLKFMKAKIRLGGNGMYNRGILFVNNTENVVDRFINSVSLTLENRKTDIVEIAVGSRFSFTNTRYSVSKALNQDFFTQKYFADFALNFAKTWNISTSLDYSIYSGPAFEESQAIPLWRAELSKYLLKNKRAQLTFSAIDMLNRNVGFNRTSELNYIQEERIVSLGRYFMLGITYNLSKFGNNRGGLEIKMNHR